MMAADANGARADAKSPPAVAVQPPEEAAISRDVDMDVDAPESSRQALQSPGEGGQDPSQKLARFNLQQPDLISRIEGDLALLLQIMSSSLHFIAHRSAHVQLSEAIPLFQPVSGSAMAASRRHLDRATMAENVEELTDDLLAKAKDMESNIALLPKESTRRRSGSKEMHSEADNADRLAPRASEEASLAARRPRRGSKQQSVDLDAERSKPGAEDPATQKEPTKGEQGSKELHGGQDGDLQDERDVQEDLRAIDEEMRVANDEYRAAMDEARTLKGELDELLRHLCDEHQSGRAWLADQAAKVSKTAERNAAAAKQ